MLRTNMKPFSDEATRRTEKFDSLPTEFSWMPARARAANAWPARQVLCPTPVVISRPACLAHVILTAVQAERRDDLLDRGLPYTWRCSIGGHRAIVREHPNGKFEQMGIEDTGELTVIRVLQRA